MHTYYTTLSLSALLASALALPHEGLCPLERPTTTVLVTITRTVQGATFGTTAASSSTHTSRPGPAIQCPDPMKPCTINGILKWPDDTNAGFTAGPSATVSSDLQPPPSNNAPVTASTPSHAISQSVPGSPSPSSQANTQDNDSKFQEDDFHMLPVGPLPSPSPSPPEFPDVQFADGSSAKNNEDKTVHTYDSEADIKVRREASKATRRRSTPLWYRFFAAAHPQIQLVEYKAMDDDDDEPDNVYVNKGENCITCEKGRDLVCIGETQYGHCDEGCVEPRRLGAGMKCVDGKIWGAKTLTS